MFARFRAPLLIGSLLVLSGPSPGETAPGDGTAVAVALYTGRGAASLGCPMGDDACALEVLVRRAHARGARLVVTPEYGFGAAAPELAPRVGRRVEDPEGAPLQTRFGHLADELDVYVVIDLETRRSKKLYNTQVAFDPEGVVVARHHKFELFEGERVVMTPGQDTSSFETPFGRVGLLICADIYGPPERHERLAGQGVDILAFSAAWTVGGALRWPAAFARDWGMVVVVANGSAGKGRGAGIIGPAGDLLVESAGVEPQVLVAELP